jgi:signal transduction histidine kinase
MISNGLYGPVPLEQMDPLVTMQNNIARLTGLIDNLLNVTKLDAQAMEFIFTRVDLNACASDVVKFLAPLAKEKKLSLRLNPSPKPVFAWGDGDKVLHIMTNLVSNALKYTVSGGAELSVSSEGNYGVVVVSDTGIGISPADRERIFDRFFRAERGVTQAKGTGLGLYIVKTLVEGQHGKIEVTDNPGGGTRFSIFLPLPRN